LILSDAGEKAKLDKVTVTLDTDVCVVVITVLDVKVVELYTDLQADKERKISKIIRTVSEYRSQSLVFSIYSPSLRIK